MSFSSARSLARGFGVVERGDDLDRLLHAFQVGGELGFEVGVEHGPCS